MNIVMKTTAMHGRIKFVAGQPYAVSERLGGYICGVGWASETVLEDGQVAEKVSDDDIGIDTPQPKGVRKGADLEIQNTTLGVKSEKVGKA